MKARITAIALALTFVGVSTAAASSITISTVAGTTYTTSSVSDYSANSSQMNGMQITAYWTANGVEASQTRIWNSGVLFSGSGFDLAVHGDTFNTDAWELYFDVAGSGRLQKLVFNGVPGNTVFDRTNPSAGTPGSDRGKDVDGFDSYCAFWLLVCLDQGDIHVTYFNQVVLGNNPFAGDLYAGVQIDFLSGGGLNEGSDWRFSLDTDIATSLGKPISAAAVPEPGSMVLFGTGLLGLAAAVRHRRRA